MFMALSYVLLLGVNKELEDLVKNSRHAKQCKRDHLQHHYIPRFG